LFAGLLVCSISVFAILELRKSLDAVISTDAYDALEAEKLRNAAGLSIGSSRSFLLTGDRRFIDRKMSAELQFHKLLTELTRAQYSADSRELLENIKVLDEKCSVDLSRLIQLKMQEAPAGRIAAIYAHVVYPEYDRLADQIGRFVQLKEVRFRQSRESSHEATTRGMKAIAAIDIGVFGLAALLSITFGRMLVQLYQEARQATQARDELISAVSHDLKTPITSARLTADLLLLPPDGDNPRLLPASAAERIRQSMDRAQKIIGSLLDLKRAEAGHLPLRLDSVPASQLVRETLDVVEPLAESGQVAVRTQVPDSLLVRCDRLRIVQVLLNIVGNAIKFTPPGGEISVCAEPMPSGKVRFRVRDTGPGISRDLLRKVFDAYWQDREVGGEGSGLGLAIAKSFIEAHGEKIWAESVPGRGSTFAFTLPKDIEGLCPLSTTLSATPRPLKG
jgi:signal transduction histidine kinase